jgi:hypothetical protein
MKTNIKVKEVNLGVPSKLRQLLTIRMVKEGWSNIRQFERGSGVPYSLETVRRAFNDCPYKNLDTVTLAVIMKHLNYKPKEIKSILSRFLSPNDSVLQLIGDGSRSDFNITEEKLVEVYRAIVGKEPKLSNLLADHLDLLGKVANVATRQKTDALRR